MEWSKAKTLLILLMLAVNLYLGINIYTQLRARTVEEAGMARDACALLQARAGRGTAIGVILYRQPPE